MSVEMTVPPVAGDSSLAAACMQTCDCLPDLCAACAQPTQPPPNALYACMLYSASL